MFILKIDLREFYIDAGDWSANRTCRVTFDVTVANGDRILTKATIGEERTARTGVWIDRDKPAMEDLLSTCMSAAVDKSLSDPRIVAAIKETKVEGLAQAPPLDEAPRIATPPDRPTTMQRWSVVVGIADYESTGPGGLSRLGFADKDANDFVKALKSNGWNDDHVRLLTNADATKRNVENALETWLRRAGKDDLIVLYWSGHGWPDPEDPEKAYFACYDSKPSDPSSGFRMDRVRQILAERNSRNVVVIADTCHSGKVVRSTDPRAVSIGPALEAMKQREQIPKGWIFIASAEADRKAYEDKAWNNGALTYVLLEGLKDGKADGYQSAGPKDGVVTMGELRAYITERMREESLNVLGARLDPLFYTTSGDPDIWQLNLRGQ